ncbi:putative Ctr copper transporter [Helianthus annuus]|uniref:Copper transport protein n=1 Tax=Helianthus annuus TaxID=4232 RepID=A0A251UA54_HELAN|nr:copper transporter 1 [Helianthus annuus]KAF5797217.1 putative Ctr copper transporter [Helianthus annuus]KAJ0548960.1 putative Ctr copper transporter [Helianthus annuus]KAJ0555174.1 putative Ctr copper transporter [Helianthus annuus]KAJ0766342.1 putative Ctr copper transporter [Helianthus annuus]KAJ0903372.1 putative Ctr copper transporter [Helianthus annuus]
MALPPPMMHGRNATMGMPRKKKMMMHMTFYWGKDALILFKGWPGTNTGMYALALVFVFFLALLVEWLAHCNLKMTKSDDAGSGLAQTLVYTFRVGLGFMVMLAIMSFNVGVFLAAVLGHALGFFFFRVILKPANNNTDGISNAC